MTDISRREALTLGAAAVAVATVPNIPFAAAPTVAAPRLPVWLVGTDGEFNWGSFRAGTEEAAKALWAEEQCGLDTCETGDSSGDCDCEYCGTLANADAQRMAKLDDKDKITPADWLTVGMGHICSRCSYETFREEGGHAVGDEAVCEDCMTLADWDIVDPERAAEMRADMADEA